MGEVYKARTVLWSAAVLGLFIAAFFLYWFWFGREIDTLAVLPFVNGHERPTTFRTRQRLETTVERSEYCDIVDAYY
jgi:hypothetical protein